MLESAGLRELAPRFAAEDVDGSVLWTLEDADLRALGLTLGQRKRLLERLKAGRPAPPPGQAPGARPRLPEPEYRRITILFSDLVGYTELTQRIDPDEMRGLLQKYHGAAREAARQFGGFIASVQGDGVVMLFGFPTAQTASAERAIGAAHALIEKLADLRHAPPEGDSIRLAARIGIASGKAIVGFPEDYAGGEPQMVGPVINRAARLQSVAPPGGVAVDELTRKLAATAFAFTPLADAALKGFGQKVPVSLAAAPLPAAPAAGRLPGAVQVPSAHEAEARQLAGAWKALAPPRPLPVLLTGDAGIGKSTLVAQFAAGCAAGGAEVLQLPCMALSAHVPLRPVISLLESLLGSPADTAPHLRFAGLHRLFAWATPTELGAVAALMGLDSAVPGGMTASHLDRRLLLATLARFLAGTDGVPRLAIIEDIHWADATTRDLLHSLARLSATGPLMLLATSRDGEDALWGDTAGRLHLALGPIGEASALRVLNHHLAGRGVAESVQQAIVTRSAGNPLMLEALARWSEDWRDSRPGQDFEVPASIYDSISARLDALQSGRKVAAALSVFDEPTEEHILALTLGAEDGEMAEALAELAAAHIIERQGSSRQATVRFRHSLYREVSYERLVKSAREQLHRSAFATLSSMQPDLASHRPGHLAWHAIEAGDHARAAPLALAAGEQAVQRSALMEAAHYLRQATASLDRLGPSTKTDQLRLRVLIAQSSISRARFGIASEEAGQLGRQVLELAQRLRETRSELIALTGLYTHSLVRADYFAAGKWAELLSEKAEQAQDATFRMIGRRGIGVVGLHTGALSQAAMALQEALDSYDEAQHLPLAYVHGYDHAEISAAFLSFALWITGDPAGGQRASAFSVSHSRRIGHMHSLAQALAFRSMLLAVQEDWQACLASAKEAEEVGRKHELGVMRSAGSFFGLVAQLMLQAQPPGAAELQALRHRHAEFKQANPYNYQQLAGMVLAKLTLKGGALDEVEEVLSQAEAVQNRTREIFLQPEMLRVRAKILLARGDTASARTCLASALRSAEKMGATMFALRIACDIAETSPGPYALAQLAAVKGRLVSDDQGADLLRCQALLAAGRGG